MVYLLNYDYGDGMTHWGTVTIAVFDDETVAGLIALELNEILKSDPSKYDNTNCSFSVQEQDLRKTYTPDDVQALLKEALEG